MTKISRNDAYMVFWKWKHEGKWMHPAAFGDFQKSSYGTNFIVTTKEHFNMLLGRRPSLDDDDLSDHEIAIVEKFLGPHGYAYYRSLLVNLGKT